MKNLELNQMEKIEGGGYAVGFWCGLWLVGAGFAIIGTGGLGAAAVATVISMGGGVACGWNIGDSIENGF
jgi:hypothetical protein